MEDYMSEADNEVDGQYFADLNYFYEQKEIRRREVEQSKIKKEENRKEQLIRQNKCIDNLKNKLKQKDQRIAELEKQLDQANEKIMWLNAEIDTLKSEKENLMRTLEEASEELEGAIVPRYEIGTKLYMIPTEFNRLKGIKDYELLSISLSSIGLRYDLCLNKKEKGIEQFYCASEDMFGQSIFATLEEAQAKLKEIQGNE